MHGPCMASHVYSLKIFVKNIVHIQDQKFNGSILKYGKLSRLFTQRMHIMQFQQFK